MEVVRTLLRSNSVLTFSCLCQCDPYFTGIDHVTEEVEKLAEPPQFEMKEYVPTEYEAVEYGEAEEYVTVDYEEFTR